MALHHKLCHVLGGGFGLPHAETHAVILPHAAAYNAPAAPGAMRAISRALGTRDAVRGLNDLKQQLVGPLSLADLGFQAADIDRAAEIACANPYPNPRPLEPDAIRALIEAAYRGRAP
jgi:maleylacetate reductase